MSDSLSGSLSISELLLVVAAGNNIYKCKNHFIEMKKDVEMARIIEISYFACTTVRMPGTATMPSLTAT